MRTIGSTVLEINEGHQIESTWLEINFSLGENLDKAFGKASFFLEAHTTFFLRIRCDHRYSMVWLTRRAKVTWQSRDFYDETAYSQNGRQKLGQRKLLKEFTLS